MDVNGAGRFRVGFYLTPVSGAGRDRVAEAARVAELAGYDSLWLRDLPLSSATFPDSDEEHEAIATAAFLAGVTSEIRIGTAVVSLPLRNPVFLARQAATVSAFSGGRFLLGVGTGYRQDLYGVFGVPFDQRHRILNDFLRVARQLWCGDPVTAEVPGATLSGQHLRPLPPDGGPPVYLASRQPPPAEVLAHLDGWMCHRGRLSGDREAVAQLRAAPDGRRRYAVVDMAVALGDQAGAKVEVPFYHNVLATDPAGLRSALRAYGEAGFDEVILAFVGRMPAAEQARLVADEVLPRLTTAARRPAVVS
jgi:luciferase-type oxidoreductase